MENTGFEPRFSGSRPRASGTNTTAQATHIRQFRPSRSPHTPPHDSPKLHEQHTGVRGERAWSVHTDPALAVVVAAWPTLSEDIRAAILRLIQGEGVR